MDNYYKLLNISSTASEEEIEEALHKEERIQNNRQGLPQLERRQEAERIVARLDKAREILLDKKARSTYDRSLKNAPQDERHIGEEELTGDLIRQGWVYLMDGSMADALYVATKATEHDGKNPEAWGLLAQVKYRKGDLDDAVYEYKRAIKLNPDDAARHFDLATVYDSMGRVHDCVERCESAYQLEPEVDEYKVALSHGYLCMTYDSWMRDPQGSDMFYATKKEHIEDAEKYIEKVENLGVEDSALGEHLAEVRKAVKSASKSKFHGRYVPGVLAILIGFPMMSGGQAGDIFSGLLYFICGILYFVAFRIPNYESNRKHFASEEDLSIFDKIDILLYDLTKDVVVYGSAFDVAMARFRFKAIMGFIKLVIGVAILPFITTAMLIKNYNNGLYSKEVSTSTI